MSDYNSIDELKVKEQVIFYCAIDKAKKYILEEEVNFNPLVIKSKLTKTYEALSLLKDNFVISFDGIEDISDLLVKAQKDIPLNGLEVAKVLNFHNHCQRIKNTMQKITKDLSIKDYSDAIEVSLDLANKIERVVDNNGNIKQDASSKLKSIFESITKNNNDLQSSTSSFIKMHSSSLQEANVFERNDRVTFLLKNSDKHKYKGYQYGSSASGLATYVEPESLIELNNKRIALENAKIEEVNRILKEITYYISMHCDTYLLNFESLYKLDVIFAKAEYGYYTNGVVASVNDNKELFLKDIIHPLIAKKEAVSNTYSLKSPYQGIVISGTNTGGKTVGLKIIGLSVLMSYLGIPLMASEANIPLYDNVYVDIDDNQSISNALSTFSAHICNINNILNSADENSLILIDELISGTDPKEAQAISLAILERILEIKSAFVITTHYDDIKQFAYNKPNILLSSVSFDLKNLKPTYRYIENSIGVSNAIDIASFYFDNPKIIERARYYLDKNKSKQEELMEKLAKEIKENEALKANLKKEEEINKELNKKLQDKIDDFEEKKNILKEKYEKELNDYIEEIKEKVDTEYANLEPLNVKQENVIKRLNDLKPEKHKEEKVIFELGDNVKVNGSSKSGELIEINGNNVSVNMGGMIIKTKLNNLTKLPKVVKKEYKPRQKLNRVSKELNLVGERVEDALVILDNYLDNAYGAGLSQVKIIHGFGTGQLRNGIRNHLKKISFVKEFANGDVYDGGSNVTLVKFK